MNLAQYKLKQSFRSKDKVLYHVVELEGNKRRLVVGVFNKAKEARSWIAINYPEEDMITEVVVADNEETKNW